MPIEITPSNSDPALATYDSPIGRLTLDSGVFVFRTL